VVKSDILLSHFDWLELWWRGLFGLGKLSYNPVWQVRVFLAYFWPDWAKLGRCFKL